MKKIFRTAGWVLVALIFVGTFGYLIYKSRPKTEEYSIVTPTINTIERTTVLTGKIEPRDEIAIKPQISGIITEILVEPGDMVKEGDIIAHIKVIPEASQLSAAQNRVHNAEIRLADARVKHDRNTTLYDKKVISREEFEQTATTLKEMEEELLSARDALDIVRNGASRYNAGESNTQVRATITGLVLDVPVKVGTSVIQANTFNDGTTVATIADMSKLIFRGSVDETEVGKLSVGMPVEITIGALPDFKRSTNIEYIAPKGNNESGANTFEIKAPVEVDEGTNLRSGYSANASVVLAKAENVVSLPESVLEFAGDSTYVYVLTDSVKKQTFERHPVTTGVGNGLNIEIKDGVDTDTKVRGAVIIKN